MLILTTCDSSESVWLIDTAEVTAEMAAIMFARVNTSVPRVLIIVTPHEKLLTKLELPVVLTNTH